MNVGVCYHIIHVYANQEAMVFTRFARLHGHTVVVHATLLPLGRRCVARVPAMALQYVDTQVVAEREAGAAMAGELHRPIAALRWWALFLVQTTWYMSSTRERRVLAAQSHGPLASAVLSYSISICADRWQITVLSVEEYYTSTV